MIPMDQTGRWTMDEGCATVGQFLHYLKFEKGFSEHTAKCYGADLAQFAGFLANGGNGATANATERAWGPEPGSSSPAAVLGQPETGTATAVATQTEQD